MNNVVLTESIISNVLKTKIVAETIEKHNDIELIVDEAPYSEKVFGYFNFEKMAVVVCADSITEVSENYSEEDLYFEITNTIIHEYRHVEQFKKLRGFLGSKLAKRILENSISMNYDENPFEIDAFKFAEIFAPSESYETFGTYSSTEIADICLIKIVVEAVKENLTAIHNNLSVVFVMETCRESFTNDRGLIILVFEYQSRFFTTIVQFWNSS